MMASLWRAGGVSGVLLVLLTPLAWRTSSGGTHGEPQRFARLRSAPVRAPGDRAGVVRVRRGILYGTVAGVRLLLDEYRPAGRLPRPAVIFVHGGGFRAGDRGSFAPAEQAFRSTGEALATHGFATFSIDYRLAPRFPFPAAEQDVLAAIRWVRRNARDLGVDSSRVGLFGASAGGNLAALAATAPAGALDRGERVRVAVSWSGPMDLTRFYPAHQFVAQYVGCVPSDCRRRYRAASPASHVDAGDPPTLLANSTAETVPLAQAREMIRRLSTARVEHRLLLIPGHRHAGQYAGEAWPATLRFLRRFLLRR